MSKLHLLLFKAACTWMTTNTRTTWFKRLCRIGSPGWLRRWPTPRRCRTCLSEWSGTDSMKKITTTKTQITPFTVFTSSQKAKKDKWAEHWKKNDHSFNNEESYFPSLTEIDFFRTKLNIFGPLIPRDTDTDGIACEQLFLQLMLILKSKAFWLD